MYFSSFALAGVLASCASPMPRQDVTQDTAALRQRVDSLENAVEVLEDSLRYLTSMRLTRGSYMPGTQFYEIKVTQQDHTAVSEVADSNSPRPFRQPPESVFMQDYFVREENTPVRKLTKRELRKLNR